MKVRITNVPPVNKKHGITHGRIFEASPTGKTKHGSRGSVNIKSDTGETVTLLPQEWMEIAK